MNQHIPGNTCYNVYMSGYFSHNTEVSAPTELAAREIALDEFNSYTRLLTEAQLDDIEVSALVHYRSLQDFYLNPQPSPQTYVALGEFYLNQPSNNTYTPLSTLR